MKNVALKISLIYFAGGTLWVLLSDSMLEMVAVDKASFFTGEIIKGTAYMLLTSLICYRIISRNSHIFIQNEVQHKSLFEDNPNPMWVYDLQSLKILAVNQAALSTYGYTREEFLSLDLLDLRPEEEFEKLLENLKVPAANYADSGVWLHKTKCGKNFFVNILSHATTFEKKQARLVLALNVHENYLSAQRIRLQNEKLREIAHIQSHKMRGPVATMLGLLAIYDRKNADKELNNNIVEKMEIVCRDLDTIIHRVVYKTCEIEAKDPGV